MTAPNIAKRLFFIVGCGRSGTTLLKSMLDTHPGVQLPAETFFYSTIRRRFPGGDDAPIEEKVRYVAARWWIRDAGIRPQDLTRELEAFEKPGWNELFLATMAAMLTDDVSADTAVGEKTPAHISDAAHLLEAFPDCRILQIVRDPRAVLASYRGVKVGTNQAAAVVREWRGAWQVHQQLESHPRYLMVRYEDLVGDAESVLRKICTFLNLSFHADMLAFHARADKGFAAEQAHHGNTLKPLFRSSLNAWKDKLPARQTAIVEHFLGNGMLAHGYQLTEPPVTIRPWDHFISESMDRCHRHIIRRPRQLAKRMRALKRLRNQGGQPQA